MLGRQLLPSVCFMSSGQTGAEMCTSKKKSQDEGYSTEQTCFVHCWDIKRFQLLELRGFLTQHSHRADILPTVTEYSC
jgi:hypothetical protein